MGSQDEQPNFGVAGANVLLVEDSAVQRLATAALLRANGLEVTLAEDGQEALDQLMSAETLPDVVLCDIGMPRMNGIALCRHIKTTASFHHLPVIMVTALGNDRNHELAIQAGADDFLYKPVKEQDLLLRLASIIARGKLRSPGGPDWHRGLWDALPEALAVTDAEHRYVDANPAALELLGYSRAELLHLETVQAGSQEPPWAAAESSVRRPTWTGPVRLRRGDGSDIPLDARVNVANLGGSTFYVLALRSFGAQAK
jgi:twitching motility two-component system response regulator PilH